jgi:hypothetical protein
VDVCEDSRYKWLSVKNQGTSGCMSKLKVSVCVCLSRLYVKVLVCQDSEYKLLSAKTQGTIGCLSRIKVQVVVCQLKTQDLRYKWLCVKTQGTSNF